MVDQIRAGRIQPTPPSPTQDAAVKDNEGAQLDRSSLDLRGKDPRASVTPITGRAFARKHGFFRMLAQLMGLPFRRDALEKTIRDALRRKPPADARPTGGRQGLHASGAKVPASLCTRMNVPCLIAWGEGFGVVVRSDADGLLVAHPRLGWLELTPSRWLPMPSTGST